MVCAHCGSESHYTGDSKRAQHCTLPAKNLGTDRTSRVQIPRVQQVRSIRTRNIRMYPNRSECGSRTHKSAMSFTGPEHKCTTWQGTVTLEPKSHNRNAYPRMETACATNVMKPATARTKVPFVHAMHVAFEVTTYQPAIRVTTTYAFCVTASVTGEEEPKGHNNTICPAECQTCMLFGHVARDMPIVWTSMPIGLTFW
jgi:hypothetical protein